MARSGRGSRVSYPRSLSLFAIRNWRFTLRPPRFLDIAFPRSLFIMTITCSIDIIGPRLHEEPEGSSVPNETSPLLQTKSALRSQRSLSERWHSNASGFLERNAGLLLIAASHFFLSAANISVQWLNRLEEHVPILEVCDTPRTIGVLLVG